MLKCSIMLSTVQLKGSVRPGLSHQEVCNAGTMNLRTVHVVAAQQLDLDATCRRAPAAQRWLANWFAGMLIMFSDSTILVLSVSHCAPAFVRNIATP